MTSDAEPSRGMLALAVVAVLAFLAVVFLKVKVRAASARWLGVRVYDFGADLKLPPTLHSRSYQFALYLTLKSLPREAGDAAGPVKGPAP